MRIPLLSTILMLFAYTSVSAKLVETTVKYADGDKKFEGVLIYDDAIKAKAPGVLITHDWLGITEKTKKKGRAVAELGYVVFLADVYGAGIRPQSPDEAGKLAGSFKQNRALFKKNMNLAFNELKKAKQVDTTKLAVTGYCFGGTGAIELARSGADVKALVSFHGGLDSPASSEGKNIKAKMLILHGADDPFVKATDLAAFETEMKTHKVDMRLIKYAGAVHSFTDETLPADNSKGAAYNSKADHESWQEMKTFLAEVLK